MAGPTRISELSDGSPVQPTDQVPVARGSGATGYTYKVNAGRIVSDLFNVGNSSTVDLIWDTSTRTLSAQAKASSSVVIQDTPPSSSQPGDFWYDSSSGVLSLRYNDGDSAQWVDVGGGDAGPLINTQNTPTVNLGWNSTTNTLSADVKDASVTNAKIAFDGGSFCFRNKIINGNFDIWQRGTSLGSGTGKRYLADRWFVESTGSTYSSSQQLFTYGQTTVPNQPKYFHRTTVTSTPGSGNYTTLVQRIEAGSTLANKTATITFWAKADSSKNISVELIQRFGNGLSSPDDVAIYCGKFLLTTSWQLFTTTVNVPTIQGKILGTDSNTDFLQLGFFLEAGSIFNARTNSLGQQSGTFDIAQVQLEEGPTATPFEHRPIGTELALCQRYYEKGYINGWELAIFSDYNQRYTMSYVYKVSKRSLPTLLTVGTQIINYRYQNSTRTNGSYEGSLSAGYLDHANLVMTLPDIPSQSNGFGTLASCNGFAVDSEL